MTNRPDTHTKLHTKPRHTPKPLWEHSSVDEASLTLGFPNEPTLLLALAQLRCREEALIAPTGGSVPVDHTQRLPAEPASHGPRTSPLA